MGLNLMEMGPNFNQDRLQCKHAARKMALRVYFVTPTFGLIQSNSTQVYIQPGVGAAVLLCESSNPGIIVGSPTMSANPTQPNPNAGASHCMIQQQREKPKYLDRHRNRHETETKGEIKTCWCKNMHVLMPHATGACNLCPL